MVRLKWRLKNPAPVYVRFYVSLITLGLLGSVVIANSVHADAQADIVVYPGIRGHALGNANATVQVDEFGDLQCGYCRDFFLHGEKIIRDRYVKNGAVRFTFYDFPQTQQHKYAELAALAAACADDQGQYWAMRDSLLSTQPEWSSQPDSPQDLFVQQVKTLGMDVDAWTRCYQSEKYKQRIEASLKFAQSQGFAHTPTIIVTTDTGSFRVQYGRVARVLAALTKPGANAKP